MNNSGVKLEMQNMTTENKANSGVGMGNQNNPSPDIPVAESQSQPVEPPIELTPL